MRKHENHCDNAKDALKSSSVSFTSNCNELKLKIPLRVVYGVKGYSPLHLIHSFRIPEFVPIDYMHCVLLGVIKRLAKLWFESTHHKNDW